MTTTMTLYAAVAIAAMLALSVMFANANALEISGNPKACGDCNNPPPRADNGNSAKHGSSDSGHHHSDKVKTIKRLFRDSNSNDDGSSAINNIPVIQPINFGQVNATTTNATATVTIPVCNGVRGGPCYDPTSNSVIP